MSPIRILGVAILVVGIVLLIVGLNASDSFADQVSNFFTGKYTNGTAWYIYGGAGLTALGFLLGLFGGKFKAN